jgi:hypothetical protein
VKNADGAFIGFPFTLTRDRRTNHSKFLLMCFTG